MEEPSNIETITRFLTAMKTQNNRITAPPYFYVIRTEQWWPSDDINGEDGPGEDEKTTWVYDKDCSQCYESRDEIFKELIDGGLTEEEADDEIESNYEEQRFVRIWVESGMFLTQTDADEHLRRNHYHYTGNAHTYIKPAWRAPELESFLKALFDHFEIKAPWYSETRYKKTKEAPNEPNNTLP